MLSAAQVHDTPCLLAPALPRRLARPAAGSLPVPSYAPRPQLPVCAQSRPRDDPGVPHPRGMRAGGRQTALPSPAPRPPPPVCAQSRPRDDPGVPRPRGMRVRGAPDRTAPSRRGVRTPKTLSPPRGGHGQHAHAPRPVPPLHRTTSHSPRRTCRPHRRTGPPSTAWTTRRHSNQRRDTGADGSARYVDGTRRLTISPRIDTYLVPVAAPQGARSARYPSGMAPG